MMEKIFQILFLLFGLAITPIIAQIQYSAEINPSNMYRISDGSEISLPFRLAELDLRYAFGSVDLITNSALEYRWSSGDLDPDLREAYFAWYPDWGEVKIGKQIHAWGAADGNNPTDNLNPYDYYYMFLPGADRKVGTVSASAMIYWQNWQVEGVFIPEHESNRLPFGEKDFPIEMPMEPEDYESVDREIEFGVRAQTSFMESDVSVSWFHGNDRSFSPLGFTPAEFIPVIHWGYRSTDAIGFDAVGFFGEFTLRVEGAYFITKANMEDWMVQFPLNAEYAQYVVQAEYTDPWDIQWSGQLIGSHVFSVDGLMPDLTGPLAVQDVTKDNFHAGMGTPFAMLTDLGVMLSAKAALYDGRLEVTANGFYDLEENGLMYGGEVSYSPIENLSINCRLNQFTGEEGSHFKAMEDFSHLSIGVKYSF